MKKKYTCQVIAEDKVFFEQVKDTGLMPALTQIGKKYPDCTVRVYYGEGKYIEQGVLGVRNERDNS